MSKVATPAGLGTTMKAGTGRRVKAGPGITVSAGPGFRQGLWYTLSTKDGVKYFNSNLMQDLAGDWWFSDGFMGPGVSRYDGANLTRFTTADGLGSNAISAVFKDRQGHLWFATEGGVSRYDGVHFTTFTTADGLVHDSVRAIIEDRQGHLWFATQGGVSRYDGVHFTTFTTADGLVHNTVRVMLADSQGNLWFGNGGRHRTDGFLQCYNSEGFITYTTADGLSSDSVCCLAEDRQNRLWVGASTIGCSYFDGIRFGSVKALESVSVDAMVVDGQGSQWFGTDGEGVYRFDGDKWVRFTMVDGLANDQVTSIATDQQGNLWFGTVSGISRYDQGALTHFTTEDGLVHNGVVSMLMDRQGNLWIGTFDGVNRFDGTDFTRFDALSGRHGWWSIAEDQQGHLWFGKLFGGGVIRYDGEGFTSFSTSEGLADDNVHDIVVDRQGHVWFSHGNWARGVSCYDGQKFRHFTTEDGLASNVGAMLLDRQGHLWFGHGEGCSCYDGQNFILFDKGGAPLLEDRQGTLWFSKNDGEEILYYDGQEVQSINPREGLFLGQMKAMLEDRRGHLWFGMFGGGVVRYDGRVFQSLTREDGLNTDVVAHLVEDRHGDIWIGTEAGINRYRPTLMLPRVQLQGVIADQRYELNGTISISVSHTLVRFEFQGSSLTTPVQRMAYVYRLEGYDADWQPIYTGWVEYAGLPVGDYTFQVRAVDRDLNYSEPAAVEFRIVPDRRDAHIDELEERVRERTLELEDRLVEIEALSAKNLAQERALRARMEQELEEARKLQLSMLPNDTPVHPQLEIAWYMATATEVGGDYYDYTLAEDGTLTLTLGDATGHGMNAGTVVTATKTLFHTLSYQDSITETFSAISKALMGMNFRRIGMAMNMIKLKDRTMVVSSAGIPPVLLYRAASERVEEILIEGMPLGYSNLAQYDQREFELAQGDTVLLMSDGLPERLNPAGEEFGYPRAEALFAGVANDSPDTIVQRLMQGGDDWAGGRAPDDDITFVVLKVKE